MRLRALAAASLASLALFGCPAMQQTPGVKAQEAANELNVNTRFGRMELAAEKVAPKAKDAFFQARKGWGGRVRVADVELAGMKMKGESDAEMLVKVAWYLVDEGDLHVTTVRQSWHDFKGDWKLVEEVRTDGEVGLLGETIERVAPKGPRNVQFPTVRLGGAGETTTDTIDAPPGTTTSVSLGAGAASTNANANANKK
jgi:hypothetical protein